jgi:hypothetical protein
VPLAAKVGETKRTTTHNKITSADKHFFMVKPPLVLVSVSE